MKKIFSITFALYFLATSVGFGVNTHFCQGKAIKSAVQLTQHELSCGMNMQKTPCDSKTTSLNKKSCCENHYSKVQVEDNFNATDIPIELNAVVVTAFIHSYLLPEFTVNAQSEFLAYSPPLVYQDIPVLYQSFLI